jgi:hypothetical protein
MSESVADVMARLLENARQLQLRSVPEPDTADEDEADSPQPTSDTTQPK